MSIVGWISLWTDPPQVRVENPTDAPIFNVRPTPTLLWYDERGEVGEMVGHSPLPLVRQIEQIQRTSG